RGFRHRIGQAEVRETCKAEKPRALRAQPHHFGSNGAIVGQPAASPRWIQARNAFSRRSRRAENCRKGATLERDKVMPCLPGRPRSAAVRAAAETSDAGRPAKQSFAARPSTEVFS